MKLKLCFSKWPRLDEMLSLGDLQLLREVISFFAGVLFYPFDFIAHQHMKHVDVFLTIACVFDLRAIFCPFLEEKQVYFNDKK